jgi:dGTPase
MAQRNEGLRGPNGGGFAATLESPGTERSCVVRNRHATSPTSALARREVPERDDPLRSAFQVDLERIVMSTAFRRMRNKTQLIWFPRNEHVRTRLTHSVEVAHAARLMSAILGLDSDLASAIAHGHDVGHAPFGHAGERAIEAWLQVDEPATTRSTVSELASHHTWSVELLQCVERSGPDEDRRGLNLTQAVRLGISNPSLLNAEILEAQVVGIVDSLVWINHDWEDLAELGIDRSPALHDAVNELGRDPVERTNRVFLDVLESSGDCSDGVRMSSHVAQLIDAARMAFFDLYESTPLWRRHEATAHLVVTHLLDFFAESPLRPAAENEWLSSLVCEGRRGLDSASELTLPVIALIQLTDRDALDLHRRMFGPELGNCSFHPF